MDWRAHDDHIMMTNHHAHNNNDGMMNMALPNPNDEESVPTIMVQGDGPGRRAGHTATAVNRRLYIFGGSCDSEYLNDFFLLDTDPPPNAIITEPASVHLFERRLSRFLNADDFSDVTFSVEGQRVYGHKLVLSIVSDCFRAMFTTGFRESMEGNAEIVIPDVSYDVFVSMMEYIYTGRVVLPGDIHHITDLLELSDQFFLDNLKQNCELLLQPHFGVDTVEYLKSIAVKTNAAQLLNICEHYVRNNNNNNNNIPSENNNTNNEEDNTIIDNTNNIMIENIQSADGGGGGGGDSLLS